MFLNRLSLLILAGGLLMVCCQQNTEPYCFQNYCFNYNGVYIYFSQELPFDAANEICKTAGGQLAAIRNADINVFINNMRKHASYYGYWVDVINWTNQRKPGLVAHSGWSRDVAKRGVPAAEDNQRPYLAVKLDLDWSSADMNSARLPYICEYPPSSRRTGISCKQDGKCYEIFHKLDNYADAQNDCSSYGGTLALVDSRTTHQFLKTLITARRQWMNISDEVVASFADKNVNVKDSWAGIHLVYPEWKFADGTFIKYTNWANAQPDYTIEECVEVLDSGKWNNQVCTNARHYCCELPQGNSASTACQDGVCYTINKNPLKYSDAANDCKTKGGKLCEIKSAKANSFALNLRLNNGASDYWIGITRVEPEFQYSDGTPISFENWEEDKKLPGDLSNTALTCPIIDKASYKWKTGDCTTKLPFICEYLQGEAFNIRWSTLLRNNGLIPKEPPITGCNATVTSEPPPTKLPNICVTQAERENFCNHQAKICMKNFENVCTGIGK